jgi:6-phosphogluconolactonase (cycloisomerase 2 family)
MPHPRSNVAALTVLAVSFTAIAALKASFINAQTSGPIAYIYVSSNYSGSNNRVVGYAAGANGQLTPIAGSPWADNLSYLATNGTYLYGSTNVANDNGKNIFSYGVESNGALKYIGATNVQAAGTQNACNQANNLSFDHSGQYLYVFVRQADCNTEVAYQSFAVNNSTGLLNYTGVTQPNAFSLGYPLTMLADNTYAYAGGNGAEDDEICGFAKAQSGNLVDLNCNTAWPGTVGQPSGSNGDVRSIAADPTNHLAAIMVYSDASTGAIIANKIATIAINTQDGSQSTSSTYSNMPTTEVTDVSSIEMAPSGALLAVGGANGIQIFNFNPNGQATANTGLITTAPITAMYWDNSNHLYAVSNQDSALHVFTVTPTSATEAAGSPYSIPHPVAMTGHSLSSGSGGACAAPSANGIDVCSPDEGASVTSPVFINAAATLSGGVYRFELWSGNTKLLSEQDGSGMMNGSVPLSPGSHKLTFDAYNVSGVHEYATRDITVTGGSCAPPSSNGINVCSPAENATASSPVTINAAATLSGGVYRFELWNGSTKLLSEDSGIMDQPVSLPAGSYHLTFDARNFTGTHEYATRDITVK